MAIVRSAACLVMIDDAEVVVVIHQLWKMAEVVVVNGHFHCHCPIVHEK